MSSNTSAANGTKFIFITGGVTSSLGKGILAASLANLMQARGLRVLMQKLDPYLNVDSGTMSPYEHGECYVTEDGLETDLDLGHYERFTGRCTSRHSCATAGSIYQSVIGQERKGHFLGKTVQLVPHITEEIKRRIYALAASEKSDAIIVEVGGSVGDMEALPFIEAIRQMRYVHLPDQCISIHLTLVPFLKAAQEIKTKPTQHAVRLLQAAGIHPDVLVCRTERPLSVAIRQKIALLCNVPQQAVIEAQDVDSIYEVPLHMQAEKLDVQVLQKLNLKPVHRLDMTAWQRFVERLKSPKKTLRIGMVGKYTALPDADRSVSEALVHAGVRCNVRVVLEPISAEDTSERGCANLNAVDALIVVGGFGERGVAGKVEAIRHARTHKLPMLGICLGLQCAAIEFAQNVLQLQGAASMEHVPDAAHPVVVLSETQHAVTQKGGSTRLGASSCRLTPGSKAHQAYQADQVVERHRHRYEFNRVYTESFAKAGWFVSGVDAQDGIVEIIELKNHPWFVCTQFHPEFNSSPLRPHPLFVALLEATCSLRSNAFR